MNIIDKIPNYTSQKSINKNYFELFYSLRCSELVHFPPCEPLFLHHFALP